MKSLLPILLCCIAALVSCTKTEDTLKGKTVRIYTETFQIYSADDTEVLKENGIEKLNSKIMGEQIGYLELDNDIYVKTDMATKIKLYNMYESEVSNNTRSDAYIIKADGKYYAAIMVYVAPTERKVIKDLN